MLHSLELYSRNGDSNLVTAQSAAGLTIQLIITNNNLCLQAWRSALRSAASGQQPYQV